MSTNVTKTVFELKKELFALKLKLCVDTEFKQTYINMSRKIKREIAILRSKK